jgi:hypothetical protein
MDLTSRLEAAVDLLMGKDAAMPIKWEDGWVPETVGTLKAKGMYPAWTSMSSINNFQVKAFRIR